MLATAIVLASCGGPSKPRPPSGPVTLTLPTVDGDTLDLRTLRGRPTVVHLFTTWSLASQGDLPQLVAAHEQHSAELNVVGVALDVDGANLVAPWQRANGIPYRLALADESVRAGQSSLGHIVEVPTTLVLRADGDVAHWLPRPLTDGELARLLRSVLTSQ